MLYLFRQRQGRGSSVTYDPMPPGLIRSDTPGIVWPALPGQFSAALLAILQQLDRSQWWPAETLRAWQFLQLERLLNCACKQLPFYRNRLEEAGWRPGLALTHEVFSRIPLLTRAEVQNSSMYLLVSGLPLEHGGYRDNTTTGSTGRPLAFRLSRLFEQLWTAINLRGYAWHQIDPAKKMAYLRAHKSREALSQWLEPVCFVHDTGPAATLDIRTSLPEQAAWLRETQANYLFTGPTNLRFLAEYLLTQGEHISGLKCIRTVGETLTESTRELSRQVFGAAIKDIYGTSEVGTIAIECGASDLYHIQSESAYVEVLREDGTACTPGETGRIVITPLHNFAMPFIRYEIGDYAEVGEPCPCGRGLPTLRRILGRVRNRFLTPHGWQWPVWKRNAWASAFGIRQIQVVQHGLDDIEVRLLVPNGLGPEQVGSVIEETRLCIGYDAPIRISYLESAAKSDNGKFEDFISLIQS